MFVVKTDRSFAVDRAAMWALWTRPEHLARWFRPSLDAFGPTVATIDLRPGGSYRIEMVRTDGQVHAAIGEFVEVDEPDQLSFTWRWDGEQNETLVEVVFGTEPDGGTSVAITHTRLSSQQDADRHNEGWIGCLESLARSTRPTTTTTQEDA